jgi:hypothetical protein
LGQDMVKKQEPMLLKLKENKGKNKNAFFVKGSEQKDYQKEFGNALNAEKNLRRGHTI